MFLFCFLTQFYILGKGLRIFNINIQAFLIEMILCNYGDFIFN